MSDVRRQYISQRAGTARPSSSDNDVTLCVPGAALVHGKCTVGSCSGCAKATCSGDCSRALTLRNHLLSCSTYCCDLRDGNAFTRNFVDGADHDS
jgi:hypothetical protein